MKVINFDKNLSISYFRLPLKVQVSSSKKVVFICANERPLKMMKNAFYFMLKALFVLETVTFWS